MIRFSPFNGLKKKPLNSRIDIILKNIESLNREGINGFDKMRLMLCQAEMKRIVFNLLSGVAVNSSQWCFYATFPIGYNYEGRDIYDRIDCSDQLRKVYIATDPVVASPWHPERMLDVIKYIGKEKPWGEWKEQPDNHIMEWFEPLKVGIVAGGMHSITKGIIDL
jgi:hypothetical protein